MVRRAALAANTRERDANVVNSWSTGCVLDMQRADHAVSLGGGIRRHHAAATHRLRIHAHLLAPHWDFKLRIREGRRDRAAAANPVTLLAVRTDVPDVCRQAAWWTTSVSVSLRLVGPLDPHMGNDNGQTL